MKTAMQELLIDLMINLEREIGHRLNMEKFAPYLEKEKEQIIDAYENGVGDENERNLSGQFTNAKQYYNQTYNQNK